MGDNGVATTLSYQQVMPLILKGFETFETCFFQSVDNGLQKVSTSLLWRYPDGVGVILR